MCQVMIFKINAPYSKYSLTLNEWRFNLSFLCVSIIIFLNSWSVVLYYVTTHPPAIQKRHSREAQIELPPLIECE